MRLALIAALLMISSVAGAACEPVSLPNVDVPASCRITGLAQPVPGSRIGYELWLPTKGWNGRLVMLGNGGYSSALPYAAMAERLRSGYAVVATDTGHTGEDPSFAIDHPEAIVDWGHRAVHITAVQAKSLTAKFYGRAPHHSYFAGCSTGGHQGFTEAQRYPQDFDGIVAGAPGHNRTHLNAGFLWQFVQNHTNDGRQIIPAEKLAVVTKAVLKACGTGDGEGAAHLEDPLQCDFDPAALSCAASDSPDCLTDEQIGALRRMYSGAQDASGRRIYFGWPAGSESGWASYWADPTRPSSPARENFWKYWVFRDAQWDWRTFDFAQDMKRTDDLLAPIINAMNPDLKAFRQHGGKLIHYHGTADPVVPFADSISYYRRVLREQPDAGKFYRFYLIPGLAHCQGGPRSTPPDFQQAIEDWVEKGRAPNIPAPNRVPTLNDPAPEYLR